MAEERQKLLLIKEYDLICDLADCKYCEEKDWCNEKDTLTRQEAIERMVLAMHNEEIKKYSYVKNYWVLAERAINTWEKIRGGEK